MTNEQRKINEAIENHLKSFLFEVRDKIANKYGAEIIAKVETIYNDAMNCPIDWRKGNFNAALTLLNKLINDKYPWLSYKAQANLCEIFIKERVKNNL